MAVDRCAGRFGSHRGFAGFRLGRVGVPARDELGEALLQAPRTTALRVELQAQLNFSVGMHVERLSGSDR